MTGGDGIVDTAINEALQEAEAVRLNPNATAAALDARRIMVQAINDAIWWLEGARGRSRGFVAVQRLGAGDPVAVDQQSS